MLVAALAVQLASILDGADGEIARVAHRGSRFERFSTPMLDRVVDVLVFSAAGLYLAVQVGGGVAAGMVGVFVRRAPRRLLDEPCRPRSGASL